LIGLLPLALRGLVVLPGALQSEALALAVPSLVTERAGHIGVTGAGASAGRQDRVKGERAGPIRARAMIDLLSLERRLDLIFVQVGEQGDRGDEVVVFWPKSTNHSHAEQFIVQIGQSESGGMKFFDPGHALLNSGSQGSEGLVRGLPDAEELVMGDKTSCRLLLDIEGLQGDPSSVGTSWCCLMCLTALA